MSRGNEKAQKYYHYTSNEGAEGILDSKVIMPSTDTQRDAVMGEGTYFTKKPPTEPSYEIARNNYGSPAAARQGLRDNKLRVALEIEFTKNANRLVESHEGSRDVYKFPGPVPLDDPRIIKSYRVHERSQPK